MRSRLSGWWAGSGKLLCLKVLLLVVFLAEIARQIGPIREFVPDETYLLILVPPVLYLIVEVVLDSERPDPLPRPYNLMGNDQALASICKRLSSAKRLD